MDMNVQISIISNDKSLITVFVKDRPIIWEAHTIKVDTIDEKTGKLAVRMDVKSKSLLRLFLDKYANVTDHTTMGEALPRLKQVLGIDEFNAAMSLVAFTESITKNMAARKFEDSPTKNYLFNKN